MLSGLTVLFKQSNAAEKLTAITTKLDCSAQQPNGVSCSKFESRPSPADSDFAFIYQVVRLHIETAKKAHPNTQTVIRLTGVLEGEKINKVFYDLKPYQEFLQYSLLIDTQENPEYVKAIKLLKQFKMVDCKDNQDINQDLQIMIKQGLLTLPEVCKELAFYSHSYNIYPEEGEVHVNYKQEVLGLLIEGIPALSNVKLTGYQSGFVTCGIEK